jgi:hypothetical protein
MSRGLYRQCDYTLIRRSLYRNIDAVIVRRILTDGSLDEGTDGTMTMRGRDSEAEIFCVSPPSPSTRLRALVRFGVAVSLSAELFVIGVGYSYALISGVLGGLQRRSPAPS